VGNTNQTPLTFTVDNTPPVINPEINPESVNPGETINITVTTSPDTQSVVAIIGTQRINLTHNNGTWTTNYTLPLDSTFDIHTIRIEGTDTVGNIGKNTCSYEIVDPNPIPSWLNDLINSDTPSPGNSPDLTTNTGPGNNEGSNNPGPGTIGGNDQLYRDQMYIRNTLTYTPTTDPNTNTTTKPPEMSEWKIDTILIGELLLAAFMIATTAAAVILAERESKQSLTEETKSKEGILGKFGELFGKPKTTKSGKIEFNFVDSIIAAATLFEFIVSPSLLSGILLFVGMFGVVFSFIAKMMYSPLMTLYSIAMLSIMSFFIVKKYWEYSHGDVKKMEELLKRDLETISERLKELFLIK
jgi:hypothetical protein